MAHANKSLQTGQPASSLITKKLSHNPLRYEVMILFRGSSGESLVPHEIASIGLHQAVTQGYNRNRGGGIPRSLGFGATLETE